MLSKERAIEALRKMPHLKDIPAKSYTGRGATAKDQAKRAELVNVIEAATRNPSYIVERNRLIPIAAAYADGQVSQAEVHRWAQIFLGRMDELHAEISRKRKG